ncbi:uncharacterized protein B0J16DRAFT_417890 [Fusarium flagelliforme]|uniref:Uncharacterized protein n=1 Tax=Fusarium flagelliforme TaxID=2675880 RepID=A0A395MEB0_9HYPO|nr:uncharacterized protein B0J16DRAFT_417890 [Fusarium flagelliforme]KAH7174374.1 hypothetical protein B0J16DRAFT_417890 [Fusarium flagelliforme]RFN45593.1 hypothetical protein FIE12Z_10147 [Fusarium flagelliforme]
MRFSTLSMAATLWGSTFALPDASLEPWDIHSSCDAYKADIKEAMTQSIELADAAKSSLEFVMNKMPDQKTDPDEAVKWQRIVTHVRMAFGYKIPTSPGPGDRRYTERLRDIYASAVNVLPSNKNSPEKGNNPILAARPNAKPVIVCGESMFQWFDADDEPEPGVGKVKDQPKFPQGYAGALYFQGRWSFRRQQTSTFGVCFGNRNAVISAHDDLIMICDAMLADAFRAKTSPRDFKASVSSGTDLRDGLVSFHTQLWHELCHWFGGVTPQLEHNIKDQIAVDKRGDVMYKGKDPSGNAIVRTYPAPQSPSYLAQRGLRKQGAYGIGNMMELAMTHPKNTQNSGPDKATTNADSLMIFSLMMYNDQWDWLSWGRARDLTRMKQKMGLIP